MFPARQLLSVVCFALALAAGVLTLRAEQFGQFTYRVVNETTIQITDYPNDAAGEVVIPAEIAGKPVTSLGMGAFAECREITSAIIPSSVTDTGFGSFSGCTKLASVTLSEGMTQVGSAMFARCGALTEVSLPASLTSIGADAFYRCGFTSITIPAGVTSMGTGAFTECTALTAITIPPGVTTVPDGAFNLCISLADVVLPAGLTGIGWSAFEDCIVLPSINIPAGVTSIGPRAFMGCMELENITLPPALQSLGHSALSWCHKFTRISIPPGVTNIQGYLFLSCPALTEVILPPGVTSIEEFAFADCMSLPSIMLPAAVADIGEKAFIGCSALTSIHVAPGNTKYVSVDGVLCNAARTTIIQYPGGRAGAYVIPSTVTTLAAAAFHECRRLTQITIPPGLAPLEYNTFSDCGALARAVFLGNMRDWDYPFSDAAPGFTVYHLSSRTGFDPEEISHPLVSIDEGIYPAAAWLLTHGFWYDRNLHTDPDPDGDGVTFLMAYALNLDPRLNLRASLPPPVVNGNTLSLTFYAAAPGLTYRVETSTNLTQWTATGVTLSAPGPDGRATATVPRTSPQRFLRLVVMDLL